MNRQQPEARLSGLRGLWQRLWNTSADSRRQVIGARAEQAAARYLRRRGYRILARNLRTRLGEIDIVAQHDGFLVVVEVRSRQEDSPVAPRETLTRQKRHKLRALAEQLRKQYRRRQMPIRVDLVEVVSDERGRIRSCEVLPGLELGER